MTFKEQFPIGSKVKIIDKRPEDGNDLPEWVQEMDAYAGQVGTVISCSGHIVQVSFGKTSWSYKPNWIVPFVEAYDPDAQLKAAIKKRDENLRQIFG